MIYDDVLDITWLQDANYAMSSGYDTDGKMTWNEAIAWADQLSFGGFNDWRLPMVSPVNGLAFSTDWGFDGSTDFGYNITRPTSELMYMYSAFHKFAKRIYSDNCNAYAESSPTRFI